MIKNIIIINALSAKWELSFTMQYHYHSVSIETGVSIGCLFHLVEKYSIFVHRFKLD